MMLTRLLVTLLGFGVFYSPGVAFAETPQAASTDEQREAERDFDAGAVDRKHFEGFFMRLGVGVASLRSRGRIDTGEIGGMIPKPKAPIAVSGDGLGAHFSFASAVGSQLLLGLELMSYMFPSVTSEGDPNAWAAVDEDDSIKYTSYGGVILFYPFSGEGFHSGLGVGLMNSWRDIRNPGFGVSVTPQLGYDVRLDKSWSVGALLRASFSRLAAEALDYRETAHVALPSVSVIVSYD
jgi:hypothetical protein